MCTGTETSPKEIVAVPVDLTGIVRDVGGRMSDVRSNYPTTSPEPDAKDEVGRKGASPLWLTLGPLDRAELWFAAGIRSSQDDPDRAHIGRGTGATLGIRAKSRNHRRTVMFTA